MNKEEIYTFNEYVLGYDKGNNDRSCLTISKIQNENMYVMSSLYDGSADVISMILDNLQQENKASKQTINELTKQMAKLVEDKKYLENQINGYRNTNINLIDKNKYLEQENKKIKERIEYLERSNNRREDTILSLRNKISDLEDNRELEKELDKYRRLIEYIKTLKLYEYELDYDYEENPVDNYYSANMEYHIDNWLKCDDLEKGDSND